MTNWQECKRISELPDVDEALRLFAEGETTEDQAVAIVQAILNAAQEPKADPISMAIANFHASTKLSKDDGEWQKLFWEVAKILKCLPSSFVDENQHVLRAAAKAMEARHPAQAAADARDAERYRMVRRGQHWSVINGIGDTLRGEDLDAAIDAVSVGQR